MGGVQDGGVDTVPIHIGDSGVGIGTAWKVKLGGDLFELGGSDAGLGADTVNQLLPTTSEDATEPEFVVTPVDGLAVGDPVAPTGVIHASGPDVAWLDGMAVTVNDQHRSPSFSRARLTLY
jgi:hypothetical protein